jgi:hypothetical protein
MRMNGYGFNFYLIKRAKQNKQNLSLYSYSELRRICNATRIGTTV